MPTQRRRGAAWTGSTVLLLAVMLAPGCRRAVSPDDAPAISPDRLARIVKQLTPANAVAPREGIAAIVLMDVSASMNEAIAADTSGRRKIDVARDAALALIRQFDSYARAHPGEIVEVGLMEFSDRPPASAREVIALSAADPARAEAALAAMRANGGTPIGEALVAGKRALDASGLSRRHLLVVTDGENTNGSRPGDVMQALAQRPDAERPSVYFVAFDIAASRFSSVRDAGALVLPAANAAELNQTLDSLLTGKILVEGP